jgi:hypothetical protein
VDDRLRPECNGLYQGRNYKTKFSVMFWGCISYYGVGTVTPVVDNLTSEKYINNLDNNLWPVIAQYFPTSPYIFQEDNVPCVVYLCLVFSLMIGCSQTDILRQSGSSLPPVVCKRARVLLTLFVFACG